MTIKQISNKIELTFWHHFINLLTDYSFFQEAVKWGYDNYLYPKNRILLNHNWRFAGTAAGLILIVVTSITFLISNAPNRTSQPSFSPIDIPNNGQRNILFVGVDDLNKESPELVGIWLLMYFPGKSNLTFAPVNPKIWSQSQTSTSQTAEFNAVIKNGSIDKKFFSQLRQEDIWWHGYVLLDSTAVKEVVLFSNQVNDLETISTFNSVNDPYLSGGPNLTGLDYQTDLLKYICQKTNNFTKDTDISKILALIPIHIRTNLNLISIIQDWKSLITQENNLVCEFPLQRASKP